MRSAEKRKTFRMPVSEDRRDGELRMANRCFPIRLQDESAGGFCAICENFPELEIGTKGLLRAGVDWYEVGLTAIQPIELDSAAMQSAGLLDENDPASYPSQQWHRLGFRRLGDTFDPDYSPIMHSWSGLFCRLTHSNPGSMGMFVVGGVLALVVAFFPFLALQLATSDSSKGRDDGWRPGTGKSSGNAGLGDNSLSNALAATAADMRTERPKSTDTHRATEPTVASKVQNKFAELRRTIQGLPGALPFALPEVVEQLKLTDAQQKRIRELIDSATEMIKNFDLTSSLSDPAEVAAAKKSILSDTLQNVLDLLDDKQKKKWDELTGEPEKNKEKKESVQERKQ